MVSIDRKASADLEFRRANASDRDYLLALRKLTMVEHLERSGLFLSDEEHAARLDHKYHCSNMVLHEGQVVGTVKFEDTGPEVEIIQIQIHPDYQNRGFGRRVVEQVLDRFRSKTITLKVLKENPALNLYVRLGFVIVGEDEFEHHMQFRC